MGTCLSKKSVCATAPVTLPNPPEKSKHEIHLEKPKPKEEAVVKKEVFIIKHRNSHEVDRAAQKSDEERGESKIPEGFPENVGIGSSDDVSGNVNCGVFGAGGVPAAVRTSSCTKEEVDAILIQCGRLSRSSSTGKAAAALSSGSGGRKYSGSKRSYDFDHENGRSDGNNGEEDAAARERENRRRERHRQSPGRRRTPSRERDRDQATQPRSGSRERGGSGGGRRVSRSPGRRSESPVSNNSNSNSSAANANSRPGKMVSVPATVSSLAMDKSTNGGNEPSTGGIKRIQVKRNVGGSPRARSPARMRASNENQPQQPMSLSRSNSRKAENSPYRRNPLGEIDNNVISQVPVQKPNGENRTNCTKPEMGEEVKGPFVTSHNVAVNVISSGQENPKPQTLTRNRSSRLSRDLDINPESLTNPNLQSSYTALLLEDIQNFHQKKNNSSNPLAFTLPPCVTKAQSILEAVADLNSSTSSNLSNTCFERRDATEQMTKIVSNNMPVLGKAKPEIRHPILESEIVVNDDLMEPSFHKYVTVRRGKGEELEDVESSGSNSFAGGGSQQQQWVAASSCSWEPNSAESTDHWTSSSRTVVSKQNEVSPVGFQRNSAPESTKRRESGDHQPNGIGRARIGGSRGLPHLASTSES